MAAVPGLDLTPLPERGGTVLVAGESSGTSCTR